MNISLKLGILEKANEFIKSIASSKAWLMLSDKAMGGKPAARYRPLLKQLAHLA